jgi:glycosyltransferase involved in cell wall biosynthesis
MDYKYRVQSILTQFDTIIVSNTLEAQEELGVPKNQFLYLPLNGKTILNRLIYYLKMLIVLTNFNPKKVVFLHSFFAPVLIFIKNIPTVLYWNEHPTHFFPPIKRSIRASKNQFMRFLSYEGAKRAASVMPISKHQLDDLIKKGCKKKRVTLIHLGVDSCFVPNKLSLPQKAIDKNRDVLEVIYIGTVSEDRGRDIMLEGLSISLKKGAKIKLTIIGASSEEIRYCVNKARILDISDELSIKGKISGQEIPKALNLADLGISIWRDQVHRRFNPPTKLFEYLASGLPVIASNIKSHSHYIRNWYNGIIFDYNSESLGSCLFTIYSRRHELSTLRQNALKSGKQYLWKNLEPIFLKTLNSL